MAAPTMHRLPALLAALTLVALAAPQATAQEPSPVRLTLASQTPWASVSQPSIEIRFRAENSGVEPLGELSIGVTLFGRVTTRTSYEQTLLADPSPAVVLDGETLTREGTLEPGQSRIFDVSLDLTFPGIDRSQPGLYPLKIDLRSQSMSLAAIRTPVIFLVRTPEHPLELSWTFVLHEGITFRPDGVFTSSALELALQPGGTLAGQLRALTELAEDPAAPPVDVALSPVLVSQLVRMRDGYQVLDAGQVREVAAAEGGAAAAVEALGDLRTIAAAPNVELSALPFAAPWLPALLAGGLGSDLDAQFALGAELVAGELDIVPDPAVLRPPAAALDEASLRVLAARGVRVLVLDPGSVVTPLQPLGFAGPATAAIGEGGATTALVPDPAVAALLAAPPVADDPVLAAQATLGELAAIWQQQPGETRAIALAFTEDVDVPGGFFTAFARGVASAPWLRATRATELATAFPPAEGPAALATAGAPSFGPTYVEELKQAHRRIDIYRSMLVQPTEAPGRLERMLLLAEAGEFVQNPTPGLAFIHAVRDAVGAVFDALRPETAQVITLTSATGSGIPVRMTNGGEEPLRVVVRLVSQHLRTSPERNLLLDAGATQTFTFDVDLKTTGRFPVQIQVVSPSGRIIREATMIVRSTAYNRIALIITIGAALLLLIAWGRRFLPRRTS